MGRVVQARQPIRELVNIVNRPRLERVWDRQHVGRGEVQVAPRGKGHHDRLDGPRLLDKGHFLCT